jgi:protein-glutamine gamma-glutamyltransferase
MPRTVLTAVLPALVVAFSWARLDETRAHVYAALAFALAPALLPRFALRLAALVPAAIAAVWIAFRVSPLDARPRDERDFFGPVWSRISDGFVDFYNVRVPFSGAEQPEMQGLLVLAVFGFCAALGLAVAARRPIPALLVLIAGAGWPATLYPPEAGVVYGAIVLTAALWLLGGLRLEQPTPAVAGGALVVLVASALSSSAAVAKDAVLHWERWEPYGLSTSPVSVDFVWAANYGGIEFPSKETVVLRVRGPQRSVYWRATTLDRFAEDRWIEDLSVVATEIPSGPLVGDPLLPAAADDPDSWTRQEVEVVGLADEHLVAATRPVAVDTQQIRRIDLLSGGVLRVQSSLQRGQRYVIHSYAPRPAAAELATVRGDYPAEVERFLDVGRANVPVFGTAGREDAVSAIFGDERYLPLWPYEGLYREAERLASGARGPYGAVVAIETWLRTTGGFSYDEQPPSPGGAPPLAHFVEEGRRGYCQQFAGAMTLMLRFLGIPARVAAGFTSGDYRNGTWTVTDRNAHTWVEVWFPRYGWLSFDPTPGRGELGADYSASSDAFNPGDAALAFGGFRGVRGGFDPGGARELGLLTELKERQLRNRGITMRDEGVSSLWVLLGLLVASATAIGLGKLVRRRARYLTKDPRLIAGAARRELADFLIDQGLSVDAGATADELRALVRSHLGIDAGAFASAAARARYGPPDGSEEAASRTRRELRSLLRVIRCSLGRMQRLRGYVAFRSLRT